MLAVAVACGLAPIGCERTPTGSSGPSGAIADPTLLPVASGQAPSPAAYDALLVANQPAGFSYNDPVTNVKIWKVTSSVVPAANTSAGHDYADGGNRASLGWGSSSNTHTILISGDGMDYHLVDFIRGVGFSNYRRLPDAAQPDRDLCFSFSNRPSQPRIAYVVHSGVLHRFNTETMQLENTGSFPRSVNAFAWLQHDRNDVWFVGLVDATTAFAWNSQTNQYLTHSETWLDEGRLERDGRYVVLTDGGGQVRLWDLSNNTFGTPQNEGINFWFAHNAGRWVLEHGPDRRRFQALPEESVGRDVPRHQLPRVQVPSVVEAAPQAVPHILEVQSPGAEQVDARWDGKHIGRATRQDDPGPREGYLHEVTRLIAGRMAQLVMRRCDCQRRRVVVHAQVHTHAATTRRGDERRERTAAVGTEQRPWSLDHQLEREGPRLEM